MVCDTRRGLAREMTRVVKRSFLQRVAVVLLALVSVGVCLADSEATVRQMLKVSGLKIGYDRKEKRIVAVGVAQRQVSSPATNPDFDKVRNELSKIAVLNAKKEVMFNLSLSASGKDLSASTTINDESARLTVSIMKLFSTMDLRGCEVLCSAESWDRPENLFQVTVAVGWSVKAADVANKVMSDSEKLDVLRLDDDEEWETWCEKNDLSTMVGCRQFMDSHGHKRYVGIGAANIEGVTGIKLKFAMRKAGLTALENLVFSLYSDNIAKDTATRYLYELETRGGSSDVSWSKFTTEVISKCKMKIMAHEVYSETKQYPITGGKMYISVYGVAIKKTE